MANTRQRADQRQRLRSEGYRPIELWLPEQEIERIDTIKEELGYESRAELVTRLIRNLRPATGAQHHPDQLELRI